MNKQKLGAIIIVVVLILIIIFNGTIAGINPEELPSGYISTVAIMNIVLFTPTLFFGTTMICGDTS